MLLYAGTMIKGTIGLCVEGKFNKAARKHNRHRSQRRTLKSKMDGYVMVHSKGMCNPNSFLFASGLGDLSEPFDVITMSVTDLATSLMHVTELDWTWAVCAGWTTEWTKHGLVCRLNHYVFLFYFEVDASNYGWTTWFLGVDSTRDLNHIETQCNPVFCVRCVVRADKNAGLRGVFWGDESSFGTESNLMWAKEWVIHSAAKAIETFKAINVSVCDSRICLTC